jgi:hypothetical protein
MTKNRIIHETPGATRPSGTRRFRTRRLRSARLLRGRGHLGRRGSGATKGCRSSSGDQPSTEGVDTGGTVLAFLPWKTRLLPAINTPTVKINVPSTNTWGGVPTFTAP